MVERKRVNEGVGWEGGEEMMERERMKGVGWERGEEMVERESE